MWCIIWLTAGEQVVIGPFRYEEDALLAADEIIMGSWKVVKMEIPLPVKAYRIGNS